jgi:hypothetical protein
MLFFMQSQFPANDTIIAVPMNQFEKYKQNTGLKADDFIFQDQLSKWGNAHYFQIKDGRCVVLPNGGTPAYPCFIFKDEATLKAYYKDKKLPIPDSCMTILELEQIDIEAMRYDGISRFKESFTKYSNIAFDDLTENELRKGHKKITALKKQISITDYRKFIVAYSILVGEYFRQKFNGTWNFITEKNGYYNYLRPVLLVNNKPVDYITMILNMTAEKGSSFSAIENMMYIKFNLKN